MRTAVRFIPLIVLSLAIVACGREAPSTAPSTSADATPPHPVEPAAPTAPAPADLAGLDTASLRRRAAEALAANRLYAPAGDNAVEDYLALQAREPGEPAVTTALADLAPYVIIGAEQATAAEAFPEAERLVALLARMDAEAPAVPRLRDALTATKAAAAARAIAAQAEADQRAAEAERLTAETPRRAILPAPPPTPTPAPSTATPSPPPATVAAARPRPEPASAPVAPRPAAPAPRPLINRVSPRFPEAATRRRLEGEVEVAVRIRADGSVEAVDVVRADPPGVFDREAVLAVRRWRYARADAASDARVVLQFKRP